MQLWSNHGNRVREVAPGFLVRRLAFGLWQVSARACPPRRRKAAAFHKHALATVGAPSGALGKLSCPIFSGIGETNETGETQIKQSFFVKANPQVLCYQQNVWVRFESEANNDEPSILVYCGNGRLQK